MSKRDKPYSVEESKATGRYYPPAADLKQVRLRVTEDMRGVERAIRDGIDVGYEQDILYEALADWLGMVADAYSYRAAQLSKCAYALRIWEEYQSEENPPDTWEERRAARIKLPALGG